MIPGYLGNIGRLYSYIVRNKTAKDNTISRNNTFRLTAPSLLRVNNRFPKKMKIPKIRGAHNMPVRIPVLNVISPWARLISHAKLSVPIR